MARLPELPNELLLNIVSHLIGDAKSLQNLCLTSRLFLAVAQPALYTCVQIVEAASDPLMHMKSFLSTLLRRPSLAKATQELYLINDLGVRYEWPALGNDTQFMEISSFVGGHPSEIEPNLCYYPLAVEVLARLPNLRHLHLTAQIEHPHALFHRLHELQSLQADTSILRNLRTIHLDKEYEDGMVNIDDYIQFMRYPSFERLATNSVTPNVFGYPSTNTLTHSNIELYWCVAHLPIIRRLLDACPRVKMFCFVFPEAWRYKTMSDVWYLPVIAPRDMVTALLASHTRTLKILHLDFHNYYNLASRRFRRELGGDGVDFSESDYTYPSFRSFEHLAHMTIEFEKLNRVSDLPESLESINLQFCRFAELGKDALSDLVRMKKWCPVIENVIVSGEEKTDEGITMVLEHARALDPPTPFQATANGRVLTFLGIGRHLQLQSRDPMFSDESDESDEDDEDDENNVEVEEDDVETGGETE